MPPLCDNLRVQTAKPLLKWAGGKRQLLEVLLAAIPKSYNFRENRYHEPFFGGGALFFALSNIAVREGLASQSNNSKPFEIGDLNSELVNFYLVVRDKPDELIRSANRLASKTGSSDFYRVRQSRPTSDVGRAVRLLYLNRLCFNGLYRVNSKGAFNVPFGNYKNPRIMDPLQIRICSSMLRYANIRVSHFSKVLNRASQGDLVYFDPPYIPLSSTASFSKYSKEGFGEADQRALASLVGELTEKGVLIILSNSDTPLSREIFQDLNLYSVPASRAISASATSRIKVKELLAVNFRLTQMSEPAKIRKFRVF